MSDLFLTSSQNKKWKQFYINTILESEVARLPHRIVEAENAIAARAKELLQESAVNIEEDLSLKNAMYFLCILRGMTDYNFLAESEYAKAA